MHLRYGKGNIDLAFISEPDQFLNNGIIIEISKTFRNKFSFCFYTRCFIQVVIITEVVLVQQQENLFTAGTAKMIVINQQGHIIANIAAMTAINRYGTVFTDRSNLIKIKKPPHRNMQRDILNRNY